MFDSFVKTYADRGYLYPMMVRHQGTVIAFAAETGTGVVAEGVETAAELQTLCALGVGKVQGFFLARPMEMTAVPQAMQLSPEAQRALAEAAARRAAEKPAVHAEEKGGPSGPEPTRFGDWERKGLAVDF